MYRTELDGGPDAKKEMTLFSLVRVSKPEEVPAFDKSIVDVAILDMNHNWPNVGHDSIVQSLADIVEGLRPRLVAARLSVRAISYDVRRSLAVPERPGERFRLYIGTGGPGHIDPRANDGTSPGSQGIVENPAWLEPAFRLFDDLHKDENSALIGVCHTFGVLCLWSGVADPVLRAVKSAGVVQNELTSQAIAHPWFARFSERLPDRKHLRVMDSRLFDLVPAANGGNGACNGFIAIGHDGETLTMMELARDRNRIMPRILAVNHHPEIVDPPRLRTILDEKLARNEVTRDWYDERVITITHSDPDQQAALRLTSEYTLLAPVRFYLYRQLRSRGAAILEDEALTGL